MLIKITGIPATIYLCYLALSIDPYINNLFILVRLLAVVAIMGFAAYYDWVRAERRRKSRRTR